MAGLPLLVLDVDGVLTNGQLPFDANGEIGKTFFVQDGAALSNWRKLGGRFALLSGRNSAAVVQRALELHPLAVLQGIADKLPALNELCQAHKTPLADVCFVGDDWADLAPMRACGYAVAVANAIPIVKRAAAYVTRRSGGAGGVAEAVEHLLRRAGRWREVVAAHGGGRLSEPVDA